MKKLLLIAVMAILAISASAQVEPGFRMGLQANVGVTNVCGEGSDMTVGYGLGWVAEYNFSSNLFFKSGVDLQYINHKEEGIDGTLSATYAQIPLNFGYRFGSMFLQAGPTVGYGLYGSKIEWDNGGSTNYFDLAKRFDLGVGGRIGIELSKLQISAGANYGLLEVFDGVGGHNLSINLGFAYMF